MNTCVSEHLASHITGFEHLVKIVQYPPYQGMCTNAFSLSILSKGWLHVC